MDVFAFKLPLEERQLAANEARSQLRWELYDDHDKLKAVVVEAYKKKTHAELLDELAVLMTQVHRNDHHDNASYMDEIIDAYVAATIPYPEK